MTGDQVPTITKGTDSSSKLLGKLVPAGFGRDALVLASGTALGRLVLITTLPLISRLYLPEQVGQWQIFVSLYLVLGPLVCMRYEQAIPLPRNDRDACSLLAACVALTVLVASAIAVLVLSLGNDLLHVLGIPAASGWSLVLPAMVFLLGVEQSSNQWLTRRGAFWTMAAGRVIRPVGVCAVPLCAALLGRTDTVFLVTGSLAGALLAAALLAACVLARDGRGLLQGGSLQRMRLLVTRYRAYPLYVVPYGLVSQFSMRLMLFVLGAYATQAVAGFFAMAVQLVIMPVSMLTGALRTALYRKTSRDGLGGQLGAFVTARLECIAALLTPPVFFFLLHGKSLTMLVLGPRWQYAGDFAVWLACPAFVLFFTAWLDRLFDVAGRQRLAVALQVVYDAVALGGFFALLAAGTEPRAAVALYSIVTVAYNLAWLVVVFKVSGFALVGLKRPALIVALIPCALLAFHLLAARLLPAASLPWADGSAAGGLALTMGLHWRVKQEQHA